ncbi:tyrosinase [Mycena latifolia]|nr:tyrosinase [Mycena latifolia]
MSKYTITGAQGGSPPQGAAAPNRVEIHDFVKIQDQFSLYIQALHWAAEHIYGQEQPDVDSFFSIAGIHGLPYQIWDASGQQPVDPEAWEGYCTHGNVLFPTWHRPYMLLFEQALQRAAIAIAATYTVDQDRFTAAALQLRQPYWDWASNSLPPPEVISLDQVSIIAPNGQTIQVDNPLRRYTFHPIDPSFPDPYSGWQTTLRHPDSTDPDATDDVDDLTSTLQSAQRQLRTKTYNLLTRVRTWPAFSNHTPGDGGSTSNSLEAIHDGIHVDVGGNGQMSDPSVAAFDPIFFLHHGNVDRLLALWSALNPGVWVTSGEATGGTWAIRPDATVDKNTDLTPFWNSQSDYWTSSEVTTTAAIGYTYPEFNGVDMSDPTKVRSAIAEKVNQLYGGFAAKAPAPRVLQSKLAAAPAQSNNEQAAGSLPHIQANLAHVPVPHHSQEDIWEWTARIRIKKYEVGGSFLVLLFLGTVPEDPKQWRTSPNFVGAHHVFARLTRLTCQIDLRTGRSLNLGGLTCLTCAWINLCLCSATLMASTIN